MFFSAVIMRCATEIGLWFLDPDKAAKIDESRIRLTHSGIVSATGVRLYLNISMLNEPEAPDSQQNRGRGNR